MIQTVVVCFVFDLDFPKSINYFYLNHHKCYNIIISICSVILSYGHTHKILLGDLKFNEGVIIIVIQFNVSNNLYYKIILINN